MGATYSYCVLSPLWSSGRPRPATWWWITSNSVHRAENIVNSRPLTIDNLSDPDAPEPITPNHLLTLKVKVVLPPPGNFSRPDLYSRRRWRRIQYLSDQFWCHWQWEYCLLRQKRQKWNDVSPNSQVDDIVLISDKSCLRNQWPLARVTEVYPSSGGLVCKVLLLVTQSGKKKLLEDLSTNWSWFSVQMKMKATPDSVCWQANDITLIENDVVITDKKELQYCSNVSWQSLEAWYSKLDSQSSILENFEDRGSSRVSRRSRPFENLSSWVSRLLSGKNKGLFARLTFDTSEYFFTGRSILISGP